MLTVEELKALATGDWIWVDDGICEGYRQITRNGTQGMCLGESDSLNTFTYSNYGTGWVAYKNKEQTVGTKSEVQEALQRVIGNIEAYYEVQYPQESLIEAVKIIGRSYGVELRAKYDT